MPKIKIKSQVPPRPAGRPVGRRIKSDERVLTVKAIFIAPETVHQVENIADVMFTSNQDVYVAALKSFCFTCKAEIYAWMKADAQNQDFFADRYIEDLVARKLPSTTVPHVPSLLSFQPPLPLGSPGVTINKIILPAHIIPMLHAVARREGCKIGVAMGRIVTWYLQYKAPTEMAFYQGQIEECIEAAANWEDFLPE